jgi:hypothetical protein
VQPSAAPGPNRGNKIKDLLHNSNAHIEAWFEHLSPVNGVVLVTLPPVLLCLLNTLQHTTSRPTKNVFNSFQVLVHACAIL